MIMTLFLIIDETKKKRKILYDFEHSNWHHIKILQHLMKHFQYDMFSGKHSTKEDLTVKKIIEIYKKNSNENVEDFEEIKDFRGLNRLDKYSIDGYVIIRLQKCNTLDDQYQDIYVNIGTSEDDREEILKSFRNKLKEIKRT